MAEPPRPDNHDDAPPLTADFSGIRYAQCWEDADVLMSGLAIRPGDTCLAIASAGDNALAMLTADPARVVALDLSAAQLACLALRVAAYRCLAHGELLELVGTRPSDRRAALYARCRPALDAPARAFWDARPALVAGGIGAAGRFENFLRLFRRYVLPLAHPRSRVDALLEERPPAARRTFYETRWANRRWTLLTRLFFSRFVVGRLGRDPSFFDYVDGGIAHRVQARVRHALVELAPARNPYLQWILTGRHRTARPLALRQEHFATIRARLDRLVWHQTSLEAYLRAQPDDSIDRFNLSNVFEYVDAPHCHGLLTAVARVGRTGGRCAYWNLFVDRRRPPALADRLQPLADLSERLHARDKAFFYDRFVVEQIR